MLITAAVLAVLVQAAPSQPGAAPPPKPFDCSGAEYRQFDFWVGDWDVVPNPATRPANAPAPPPGRTMPRNTITRIQDGCAIHEKWVDGQGGTGESFNVFDRVKQLWHQTWVDNRGSLHFYWGELKNGSMVMIGEVPLAPQQRVQGRRTVRVTFTPIGTNQLRQSSEQLNSDGTWTPAFDFLYTRRPATR